MAQTWLDAGARRASVVPLALQGLRHRVTRPVAAAGLDLSSARPGQDVVIGGRPRLLLIGVVAMVSAVAVAAVQLGLTWALGIVPSTGGSGRMTSELAGVRDGLLVSLLVGVPLAVAVWGEGRTRHRQGRDSGIGLLLGAGLAVLLVFVVPAVAS